MKLNNKRNYFIQIKGVKLLKVIFKFIRDITQKQLKVISKVSKQQISSVKVKGNDHYTN